MKIIEEKKMIRSMIEVYCRRKHGSRKGELCQKCSKTLDYCNAKLDKCPWGDRKGSCLSCKIHCYSPAMRDEVKKIMRFSGPKMIFYHPILTIKHFKKGADLNEKM